ncbi:OmpA family protein [Intrasporangium sp.]|uniref:OmpA family protein n=1 Tax=Intrasporangium sp. TaxID=1925024 RepID=UPI0032218456
MLTTKGPNARVARAAASILALGLAGCSTPSSATPSPPTRTLTSEQAAGCRAIFDGSYPDPTEELIIIDDQTASRVGEQIPSALADAITTASTKGGLITVLAVDGANTNARIIAKRVPLSQPGERDRPSVARTAAFMPACVKQLLLSQASPTATGTDLYTPLAAVAELVANPPPGTTSSLWLLTDMIANTGQASLNNPTLLQEEPDVAAHATAATAPLNLHGIAWHLYGVANTHDHLLEANRVWLRDYSIALCKAWRASGCEENIRLDPPVANGIRRSAKLPADAPIPFPSAKARSTAGGCAYAVPGGLLFAGDSAVLRPEAREALAGPIRALKSSPAARAVVTGHTASSNAYTDAQLVDLSKRRAAAVAAALTAGAGIPADRVSTHGVGDHHPLHEDIDPKTGLQIPGMAALERRADLTVTGATTCR